MKLSIIQTGEVLPELSSRFGSYASMFQRMFDAAGAKFTYDVVPLAKGAALPSQDGVEAILITGSAAGVYDDLPWFEALRNFIRQAYVQRTPMVGICFGHQIMADALGGEVRKSEKGWGIGRHSYDLVARPAFMHDASSRFAISCSHQDQVVNPPQTADTFLASAFTPHAGLAYENGAALSLQPHPEFTDDYALALAKLRVGVVPVGVLEAARTSFLTPSNSQQIASYLTRFLANR